MFDSWNRSRKHRQNGTLETWIANRSWIEKQRSPGAGPRVDTAGHADDPGDPGSPPRAGVLRELESYRSAQRHEQPRAGSGTETETADGS